MNYHKAMETINKDELQIDIRVKHEEMKKYEVFTTVHKEDEPPGIKIVDYTWAMK